MSRTVVQTAEIEIYVILDVISVFVERVPGKVESKILLFMGQFFQNRPGLASVHNQG